ncbi:FAD-dependent oxidoreductase [Desulfofustis glycolicus]|uniref:L-aspartate oxidase n=1 Tax=Desulfofustis glycolicus DSM 9705 TaxID=1121409 RepID=A0A1M5TZL4_9BACT|nr:FAD-binding protein [Desulfofustis glycolicus]MCB2214743.1 FAD-binding protein [Desulfobulbaceae bacterium]SHH56148.1 L-aspartate oxidase [Desulfofustis glycolicus DSM 9705]
MNHVTADILVVGSGIAGFFAIYTAQQKKTCRSIVVLNKGRIFQSGSSFDNLNGKWGITYGTTDQENDLLLARINDLACGNNNPQLSSIAVESSHGAYRALLHLGVRFAGNNGTTNRISPCFHDQPLASIISSTEQLSECLRRHIDRTVVNIFDWHRAIRLLMDDNGCCGCLAVNEKGEEVKVRSRATIMACGGNAALHNPHIVDAGLTGDGYRMLQEIGVPLKNMDYRQLVWEDARIGAPRFPFHRLLDRRLRFVDYTGRQIMIHDLPEEVKLARKSHVPIANLQRDRMLDELLMSAIPVSEEKYAIRVLDLGGQCLHQILPHTQASNGGVEIGINGETGVRNLYAAGEMATGMHGGDRVGGMMITAAIVFGSRAGLAAAQNL